MAKITALMCLIVGMVAMMPNVDGAFGVLRVTALSATDLWDRDPGIWNAYDTDPYMQAVAVDDKRKRLARYTSTKSGNLNPTWNEELYVGWGTWEKVWIHFYDADDNADDTLSDDVPFGLAIGDDYEQSIHLPRRTCTN